MTVSENPPDLQPPPPLVPDIKPPGRRELKSDIEIVRVGERVRT